MEATARQVDWYLVPPGGHETMKTRAIIQDVWRDEGGGYIKKGPVPKGADQRPASARAIATHRQAGLPAGRAPRNADSVHYEEGGAPASINSPVVQNGRLETSALKVSFLAIDTTGLHEPGPRRRGRTPSRSSTTSNTGMAHTMSPCRRSHMATSATRWMARRRATAAQSTTVSSRCPPGTTTRLAVAEHRASRRAS